VLRSLRQHWPEYLIEATGLGAFMLSAGVFAVLLEFPGSPLRQALPDPEVRRLLTGVAMGLTAISIIYSPWGKRSGAHINPAVTLTFLRLGKVHPWDAAFYVLAQFIGAVIGLSIVVAAGAPLADPAVRYVVTVPGPAGLEVAFVAEAVISFGLMLVVLLATNSVHLARYTGLFAGLLVATYIALEAPLSGMSMNPARTVGSAVWGHVWTAAWLYFVAPLAGMLAAAETYTRLRGRSAVHCAKLHHVNNQPCIFRCGYGRADAQ